jgi:hypothetical protein
MAEAGPQAEATNTPNPAAETREFGMVSSEPGSGNP